MLRASSRRGDDAQAFAEKDVEGRVVGLDGFHLGGIAAARGADHKRLAISRQVERFFGCALDTRFTSKDPAERRNEDHSDSPEDWESQLISTCRTPGP